MTRTASVGRAPSPLTSAFTLLFLPRRFVTSSLRQKNLLPPQNLKSRGLLRAFAFLWSNCPIKYG